MISSDKKIEQVVVAVRKRVKDQLAPDEFKAVMADSFRFYARIIALTYMNIRLVSSERYPTLICNMKTTSELDRFIDFMNDAINVGSQKE